MRLFSFLLDNRTIKKLSFLILFGAFAHSVSAQWMNVSNINVSGDVLTSTYSYSSQHAMTAAKIQKTDGGTFDVNFTAIGNSGYYNSYFGLSNPMAAASSHNDMILKVAYEPGGAFAKLYIYANGTTVYSNGDAVDYPNIRFQINQDEVWVIVNEVVEYVHTDMTILPDEFVGHVKLGREGAQVNASINPVDNTQAPCSCDQVAQNTTDEDIYWMNTYEVSVDGTGKVLTSIEGGTSYGMTADPISSSHGGTYTIDVQVADYDDIWIGLTDDVNSTSSSGTMDFKFFYESSFQDLGIYDPSQSGTVYYTSSGPQLAEFKFAIENGKVDFIVNNSVLHTYTGTIPDDLYLHIIFTDNYDQVEVSVTQNDPENPWTWQQSDDAIYHDGPTVGINTTNPNLSYGLDVDGDIKSSGGNSMQWDSAYAERGSAIAGSGLEWSANQLNVVSNSTNWDAAYTERGSVIGGTGLSWTGNKLHFNGNLINGNGIGWDSNRLYVRGNELVGAGFEWDSSNEKFKVDGSQFEGQGLAWDGSTLYIKGDEIDGNGLKWNSSNGNMFVDGGSMDGHGIDWVSNDFVVDGAVLTGSGLSWDGTKFNVTTSSPWTSSAGLISYTSGKIGVGTNAVGDDYLMSIDGMVEAEEIVVQVVGVPDYVFHEDYNLSPLDEVKNFIEKNSHLPEIPSAVELEETGMSLGEMNLLLLKKIEELTLHLIEIKASSDAKDDMIIKQNKKMEQLNRRLEAIETKSNNQGR